MQICQILARKCMTVSGCWTPLLIPTEETRRNPFTTQQMFPNRRSAGFRFRHSHAFVQRRTWIEAGRIPKPRPSFTLVWYPHVGHNIVVQRSTEGRKMGEIVIHSSILFHILPLLLAQGFGEGSLCRPSAWAQSPKHFRAFPS